MKFISHHPLDPALRSFPDLEKAVLAMNTAGDRTYSHTHTTSTNSGALGDMPAIGKAIDVMGVYIIRFGNGKAAEQWGSMEEAKMMQQLGLMPPPGAEEESKKE